MTRRKICISPVLRTAAEDFGLEFDDVQRIIISAPARYKSYNIKKRDGGTRVISQPSRDVKLLQYCFMEKCKNMLRVHSEATPTVEAWVSGKTLSGMQGINIFSKWILKIFFHR